MDFKFARGFTLTEFFLVIVIIAILAIVILAGIGGLRASDRDAKRITDLNLVRNYLKLYNMKFGHYPGNGAGDIVDTTVWGTQTVPGTLSEVMHTALGIGLPNDPIAGATYRYKTISSTDNSAYVLGATLERDNSALRDQSNVTNINMPAGFNIATCDNSSASREYCIGS